MIVHNKHKFREALGRKRVKKHTRKSHVHECKAPERHTRATHGRATDKWDQPESQAQVWGAEAMTGTQKQREK